MSLIQFASLLAGWNENLYIDLSLEKCPSQSRNFSKNYSDVSPPPNPRHHLLPLQKLELCQKNQVGSIFMIRSPFCPIFPCRHWMISSLPYKIIRQILFVFRSLTGPPDFSARSKSCLNLPHMAIGFFISAPRNFKLKKQPRKSKFAS